MGGGVVQSGGGEKEGFIFLREKKGVQVDFSETISGFARDDKRDRIDGKM